VAKTASGLLKLIYPHRTADDLQRDELALCLDLAAECRERIIDQLAIMAPGEFKPVRFELL
jgi:predicted ATP-dependent Lon-type protease